MLIIALLAASAVKPLVGAKPIGDVAYWVRGRDVPAVEQWRATFTSVDLVLNDRGKPVKCYVTRPSGSEIIDRMVCRSLLQRAVYSPARDADGNALPATDRIHLAWRPDLIGTNDFQGHRADIAVTTPLLQAGDHASMVQVVEVLYSEGDVTACYVNKRSKVEPLNDEACNVAGSRDILRPMIEKVGTDIRGARSFNISFTPGSVRNIQVVY